jgi:Fibrinogen beta and gamma chains, C-terminal globular domain
MGNENIYMLTNNDDYALRIELEDFEGNKRSISSAFKASALELINSKLLNQFLTFIIQLQICSIFAL